MFWKPNITLKKGSIDPTITLEQYTLLPPKQSLREYVKLSKKLYDESVYKNIKTMNDLNDLFLYKCAINKRGWLIAYCKILQQNTIDSFSKQEIRYVAQQKEKCIREQGKILEKMKVIDIKETDERKKEKEDDARFDDYLKKKYKIRKLHTRSDGSFDR